MKRKQIYGLWIAANLIFLPEIALARADNATATVRYSKVSGIVESVNSSGRVVSIKKADGSTVSVPLVPAAKILRDSANQEISQIQVGDRITVRYDLSSQSAPRVDVITPRLKTSQQP